MSHFRSVSYLFFIGLAAALVLNPICADEKAVSLQALGKGPHGDSEACTACHVLENEELSTRLLTDNALALCQSCHDGQRASEEAHPVGMSVGSARQRLGSEFPLQDGRMTCLTCHDMGRACETEKTEHMYLRGKIGQKPIDYCAQCHDSEQAKPLNVHDQMDGQKLKIETCQWCHIGEWDVETPGHESPVYLLRPYGTNLCENCHAVAADHPSGGPHVNKKPSEDMLWYMAASEMRAKMRLPLEELLKAVKATKRYPRVLPLDAKSRVACYTCHNPHETGVIRKSSPRALGAEPKQAQRHRLRASKGQMCQACHNI